MYQGYIFLFLVFISIITTYIFLFPQLDPRMEHLSSYPVILQQQIGTLISMTLPGCLKWLSIAQIMGKCRTVIVCVILIIVYGIWLICSTSFLHFSRTWYSEGISQITSEFCIGGGESCISPLMPGCQDRTIMCQDALPQYDDMIVKNVADKESAKYHNSLNASYEYSCKEEGTLSRKFIICNFYQSTTDK